MPDSKIAELLHGLGSRDPQPAWTTFLETYSAIISQVVRWSERNPDESADCFVYVCEQLSRNQFRRLRRFHLDGRASFPTWLRAVVRNLCLDWHRRRFGRYRIFQSVSRLSDFDQQVFRCICEQDLSTEECVAVLRQNFGDVSAQQVDTSLQQLRKTLSPRQLWLLNTRRRRITSLSPDDENGRLPVSRQIQDTAPDPEIQFALKEGADGLHRALARLSNSDRLLLQLRFEQELTLAAVARTLSLKDAQTADRRIHEALARIRELLGVQIKVGGKTEAKSV